MSREINVRCFANAYRVHLSNEKSRSRDNESIDLIGYSCVFFVIHISITAFKKTEPKFVITKWEAQLTLAICFDSSCRIHSNASIFCLFKRTLTVYFIDEFIFQEKKTTTQLAKPAAIIYPFQNDWNAPTVHFKAAEFVDGRSFHCMFGAFYFARLLHALRIKSYA